MNYDSPFEYFENWFKEACSKIKDNPNAVTIASCTKEGKPSARTVLLKDHSKEGFTFFTNYNSRKSQELLENPNVSLLFYWRGLERQIRIEGTVEKTSTEVSDNYWNSRHPDSQANSSFSKQSSIILNEKDTAEEIAKFKESLDGKGCERPENWGGFILKPTYFEFWSEGPNRWHLRHAYTKKLNSWNLERLYP